MSRKIALLTFLLIALYGRVYWQDLSRISGQWQGTLKARADVRLMGRTQPLERKELVKELLTTSLPQLTKVLQEMQAELEAAPAPGPAPAATTAPTIPPAYAAIQSGVRKFTDIRSPALSIVALPAD